MSIDDTVQFATCRAVLAITESTEESEVEALMADIDARVQGLRRLIASRADAAAREALGEEIGRLIADAQQLDAHLSEPALALRDAAADEVLSHLERREGES
jgi:hypothetical protein